MALSPTKATLPILETILFESEDGRLKLTATDLEISIVEYISADIEEEGAVAIPAKRLQETLRQLPNIPVFFEVDENHNVQFRTDKGKYKLVGEDFDDFPEIPNMDEGVKLSTDTDLITTLFSARCLRYLLTICVPPMMGVYFDIGTGGSKFVATDGHRLVRFVNSNLTSETPLNFIVPEKALNLVSKALDAS